MCTVLPDAHCSLRQHGVRNSASSRRKACVSDARVSGSATAGSTCSNMSSCQRARVGPRARTSGATAADDLEFSDLFSVRRPKNVLAGLSSGTQSVLKGVTAGVATLIAAPIVGANQEGTSGFFKGLGAGARPANRGLVR